MRKMFGLGKRTGLVGLAALTGGLVLSGCGAKEETRGALPPAPLVAVRQLTTAAARQTVTLRGEMIEKCPVAGCWFMLRDKTGVVRVDTKAAGFVVLDVPLHTTVTVGGAVVAGTQPSLAATGMRF